MAHTKLDFSRIVGTSKDAKPFLPLDKDIGVEYYEKDTRRIYVWSGIEQGWELFYAPGLPTLLRFTELLDTPADYDGHALKTLVVNVAEDGITYSALASQIPTGFELVGDGYRLVGDDPALKDTPGNRAVDASLSSKFEQYKGGVGSFSWTQGYDVLNPAFAGLAIAFNSSLSQISSYGAIQGTGLAVDGYASRAYGVGHTILGHYSIAEIEDNGITGNRSSARGSNNLIKADFAGAYSDYSFLTGMGSRTLGTGLFARAKGETAAGHYNTDYVANQASASYDPLDRAFVVGIGTEIGFEKDGFIVRNDGTVIAPGFTIGLIDAGPAKGLITREWFESNPSVIPTLDQVLTEGATSALPFAIETGGYQTFIQPGRIKLTSLGTGDYLDYGPEGLKTKSAGGTSTTTFVPTAVVGLTIAMEMPSVSGKLALVSEIPTDTIGEAPNDGLQYARQSQGWAQVVGGGGGIPEAPLDGQDYARNGLAGSWVPVVVTGIGDAPSDATPYVRQDAGWISMPASGIGEAPNDGNTYARKSEAWSQIVGMDLSGLVPYIGATQDLNLGLFNSVAFDHVNTSDRRLKENIEDYAPVAVPVIWRTYNIKENGEFQLGLIADEVEAVNPDFVVKGATAEDMDAVKYTRVLIAKVAELEARLRILETN